jgi:hypothetical protein
MPGVWLTAIARLITRTDTFDSLVAPALADLQYEAASRQPTGRHYAALVIVIATALLRDFHTDVQLTFGAPRVWRRTATWWAGFGILYVATVLYADTPWHLLDATGQAAALAFALVNGVVGALPVALVAAVFHLRRESAAPRRCIGVTAMTFFAAAVALQLTTVLIMPSANRILVESVSGVVAEHRAGAGLDDEIRYPGQWQRWVETRRERSASPSSKLTSGVGGAIAAFTFSLVVTLAAFVMFGVVLARGRRWTVFLRVVGLFATYTFLQVFIITLQIPMLTAASGGSDGFRQMVVMLVTALAWLLGVRLFILPLLPIYALTTVRRLVRRSPR